MQSSFDEVAMKAYSSWDLEPKARKQLMLIPDAYTAALQCCLLKATHIKWP